MPACPRPGAGIPELTVRVARAATPAPGTREAGLGKGRARGVGFTVLFWIVLLASFAGSGAALGACVHVTGLVAWQPLTCAVRGVTIAMLERSNKWGERPARR